MTNEAIEIQKKKYKKYEKYLSDNFFEKVYKDYLKEEEFTDNVSDVVSFSMYATKKVYFEFSKLINDGNVDLEIELIDENRKIFNIILPRMNLENIDNEQVLMDALESYDGSKLFSLHIVDTVRKKYQNIEAEKEEEKEDIVEIKKSKKQKKKKGHGRYSDSKTETILPSQNQIVNEKENAFEARVLLYVKKHREDAKFDEVDGFIIRSNLINKCTDEELKTYLLLRYGHFKNCCFNNDEISEILEKPKSYIVELQLKSIDLLKKFVENTTNQYMTKVLV